MILICEALRFIFPDFQNYISMLGIHSLLGALGHHIMSVCFTDSLCGNAVINENNNPN